MAAGRQYLAIRMTFLEPIVLLSLQPPCTTDQACWISGTCANPQRSCWRASNLLDECVCVHLVVHECQEEFHGYIEVFELLLGRVVDFLESAVSERFKRFRARGCATA